MKDKLYGLDLFSGIGGNTLGLREHVKTIAYCEQDKHAQSVLLSRMADGSIESAPIWDDVSTLRGDMFDLPIDIIIAGFPCQDISVAGKGAGLAGQRSGLFFEIVRLAKEIKPTFLFLENVPAIRTRGLDRVVGELTEAGYDCRWCMLSASEVGAPHKRERWFLLARKSKWNFTDAYSTRFSNGEQEQPKRSIQTDTKGISQKWTNKPMANSIGFEFKRGGESQNLGRKTAVTERKAFQWERSGNTACTSDLSTISRDRCKNVKSYLGGVADGISPNVVEGGFEYLDPSYWEEEPEVPRVTQEKEQRVERLKRLGNGVVPLQALTAFQFLLGLKDGTR